MIVQSLVGLSLIVAVAVPSAIEPGAGAPPMSTQQKNAVLQPLVRSATECVLRAVAGDPRFRSAPETDIRELIVASMPACAEAMRTMIDAHDRLYGEGSGEQYFMGPYLDTLPAIVLNAVRGTAR